MKMSHSSAKAAVLPAVACLLLSLWSVPLSATTMKSSGAASRDGADSPYKGPGTLAQEGARAVPSGRRYFYKNLGGTVQGRGDSFHRGKRLSPTSSTSGRLFRRGSSTKSSGSSASRILKAVTFFVTALLLWGVASIIRMCMTQTGLTEKGAGSATARSLSDSAPGQNQQLCVTVNVLSSSIPFTGIPRADNNAAEIDRVPEHTVGSWLREYFADVPRKDYGVYVLVALLTLTAAVCFVGLIIDLLFRLFTYIINVSVANNGTALANVSSVAPTLTSLNVSTSTS